MENGQYGNKFKAFNPQYDHGQQGGGQPQGQRGGGKKDDVVQLYIIRQSSIKAAVDLRSQGTSTTAQIIDIADEFVQYVMNGKTTAGVSQGQQQGYNQAADGQRIDDDIPF